MKKGSRQSTGTKKPAAVGYRAGWERIQSFSGSDSRGLRLSDRILTLQSILMGGKNELQVGL